MIIGHYGLALAVKARTPKISLVWLFLATQLPDLLSYLFILTGLEKIVYSPGETSVVAIRFVNLSYSHSLLMAGVWSLVLGAGFWFWRKRQWSALILAGVVFSHWCLDLIVHKPHLALHPGSSLVVGMGLYHSFAGTVAVEMFLFIAGMAYYINHSIAHDLSGQMSVAILSFALVGMYVVTLFPLAPSSAGLLALFFTHGVMIGLSLWVDRHRSVAARFAVNPVMAR